mgnify:CR=1 FL=1
MPLQYKTVELAIAKNQVVAQLTLNLPQAPDRSAPRLLVSSRLSVAASKCQVMPQVSRSQGDRVFSAQSTRPGRRSDKAWPWLISIGTINTSRQASASISSTIDQTTSDFKIAVVIHSGFGYHINFMHFVT